MSRARAAVARRVLGAAALLAWSAPAGACPGCLATSNAEVTRSYLLSTYFLSLLPFGIVGAVAATVWVLARRASRCGRTGAVAGERPASPA